MIVSPDHPEIRWSGPRFQMAVTGGIGSGKSWVTRQMESAGAEREDADRLAHRLLKEPQIIQAIQERFGSEILNESGEVDRPELASRVFQDSSHREFLNGLIHPGVRRLYHEWLQSLPEGSVAVYDIPLLFEANLESQFDCCVTVTAPLDLRFERVQQRNGWSREQFLEREESQMKLSEKEKRSDLVIKNDGTVDLESWIPSLIQKIQEFRPGELN